MAKYVIAPGTTITSKGIILNEGREVTKDNFPTEEIFNSLVKSKKILSSEEKAEDKKQKTKDSDEKKSESKDTDSKKSEEKK
jgi:sorbitol-specific phosphotransferase system component IIBC